MFINIKSVLAAGLVLTTFGSFAQQPVPLILAEGFERTQYVGKWTLPAPTHPSYGQALESLYIGSTSTDPEDQSPLQRLGINPAERLFTVSTVIGQEADGRPKLSLIPDLLYQAKLGTDSRVFGMRAIPIPYRRNRTQTPLPSTYYINPFLTKLFYNVDMPLGTQAGVNDKSLYVITPHSNSSDMYFPDFGEMTQSKAEISTGHASAYAYVAGMSDTTRRDFGANNGLDHGTLNNLYAISMRGTDQEAVNLNLSLWSNLYYNNPDGYSFANDYHFDWVMNVNAQEVFAYGRGWLDRTWVRRDMNEKIHVALQEPGARERYQAMLEERGDEKPQPFNPNTHTYYKFLKEEPAFFLYCYEGVATTNFLGLNVPLTLAGLQVIYGAEAGARMFTNAKELWAEIQIRAIASARELDSESLTPEQIAELRREVLELDAPAIQNVLARMSPLWQKGLSSANKFTAQNPVFPDRDAAGNALNVDATFTAAEAQQRDTQLAEVGTRALPFKPQTTADILRATLEIYAPYHKVGAARDAAVIIAFVDKIKERTGLLFEPETPEYGFAVDAVKILFKHEGNMNWARLNSAESQTAIRAAVTQAQPTLAGEALTQAVAQATREKYEAYITGTNQALDGMITRAKNPEGNLKREEEEAIRQLRYSGFSPAEIQRMIDDIRVFRRERNQRLFNRMMELKRGVIAEALAGIPAAPLRGENNAAYPTDGTASYALMRKEIFPVLDRANELPVRQPNLIAQILGGEKYIKYNMPPGIVQVLALGIQEVNANIRYTPVATMVTERALVRQVLPTADPAMLDRDDVNVFRDWADSDPHFATLQTFFREFPGPQAARPIPLR